MLFEIDFPLRLPSDLQSPRPLDAPFLDVEIYIFMLVNTLSFFQPISVLCTRSWLTCITATSSRR